MLGGSDTGASLGIALSKWSVDKYLEKTLASRFNGDETRAAKHRRKWHLYHVTTMDDKLVWRHHIVDFTQKISLGNLSCIVPMEGKNNEKHLYNLEGAFRDSRLMITQKEKLNGCWNKSIKRDNDFVLPGA